VERGTEVRGTDTDGCRTHKGDVGKAVPWGHEEKKTGVNPGGPQVDNKIRSWGNTRAAIARLGGPGKVGGEKIS